MEKYTHNTAVVSYGQPFPFYLLCFLSTTTTRGSFCFPWGSGLSDSQFLLSGISAKQQTLFGSQIVVLGPDSPQWNIGSGYSRLHLLFKMQISPNTNSSTDSLGNWFPFHSWETALKICFISFILFQLITNFFFFIWDKSVIYFRLHDIFKSDIGANISELSTLSDDPFSHFMWISLEKMAFY